MERKSLIGIIPRKLGAYFNTIRKILELSARTQRSPKCIETATLGKQLVLGISRAHRRFIADHASASACSIENTLRTTQDFNLCNLT